MPQLKILPSVGPDVRASGPGPPPKGERRGRGRGGAGAKGEKGENRGGRRRGRGGGRRPRPSEPDRALPCPVRGLDGHGRALPGTVGFSPVHIVLIPLPLGPPRSALSSSDPSGSARGHGPRLASPTLACAALAVSGGKRHEPGPAAPGQAGPSGDPPPSPLLPGPLPSHEPSPYHSP